MDVFGAEQLFNLAIEEGNHAIEIFNVGNLHKNGSEGVAVDLIRVKQLYSRIIEEVNHINSIFNLKMLLKHGLEDVAVDTGGASIQPRDCGRQSY